MRSSATTAADLLDRLVETLQSAGYPPVDVDGPDPDSFPPPTDRIAAAATQCEGLMRGLDPAGWQTEVGDQSIAEHTQHAVTHLRSMTTDS